MDELLRFGRESKLHVNIYNYEFFVLPIYSKNEIPLLGMYLRDLLTKGRLFTINKEYMAL